VTADGFNPARVKLFFELLRRHTVSSGELNVSDAESTHLIERLWNIFLELIAQTVKLKTHGFSWNGIERVGPSER
jgi:hypothetical protein